MPISIRKKPSKYANHASLPGTPKMFGNSSLSIKNNSTVSTAAANVPLTISSFPTNFHTLL